MSSTSPSASRAPCSQGVPGSDTIAAGYWQRDEATAETFVTAGCTPAMSYAATRTASTTSSTGRRT